MAGSGTGLTFTLTLSSEVPSESDVPVPVKRRVVVSDVATKVVGAQLPHVVRAVVRATDDRAAQRLAVVQATVHREREAVGRGRLAQAVRVVERERVGQAGLRLDRLRDADVAVGVQLDERVALLGRADDVVAELDAVVAVVSLTVQYGLLWLIAYWPLPGSLHSKLPSSTRPPLISWQGAVEANDGADAARVTTASAARWIFFMGNSLQLPVIETIGCILRTSVRTAEQGSTLIRRHAARFA